MKCWLFLPCVFFLYLYRLPYIDVYCLKFSQRYFGCFYLRNLKKNLTNLKFTYWEEQKGQ